MGRCATVMISRSISTSIMDSIGVKSNQLHVCRLACQTNVGLFGFHWNRRYIYGTAHILDYYSKDYSKWIGVYGDFEFRFSSGIIAVAYSRRIVFWFRRVSVIEREPRSCSRINQSAVCELNFSDMVAFNSNLGKWRAYVFDDVNWGIWMATPMLELRLYSEPRATSQD
jgi:hypothetical protein